MHWVSQVIEKSLNRLVGNTSNSHKLIFFFNLVRFSPDERDMLGLESEKIQQTQRSQNISHIPKKSCKFQRYPSTDSLQRDGSFYVLIMLNTVFLATSFSHSRSARQSHSQPEGRAESIDIHRDVHCFGGGGGDGGQGCNEEWRLLSRIFQYSRFSNIFF